jgi:lysozyme family protein
MALEQREPWIVKTLEWEGGGKFTNRKEDRGGPTKYGITMPALAQWRHLEKVSETDVAHLEEEEAKNIYRADYWGYLSGDSLPAGVDWCLATIAVLSGPATAAKLLQAVVGSETDGMVGKETIAACRAMRPMDVLLKIQAKYLVYLVRIRGDANDAGWMTRWSECLIIAESRIDTNPTTTLVNNSPTIKAAGAAATVGGASVWMMAYQYGSPMFAWAKDRLTNDPQALERLQDAAFYAGTHISPPAIMLLATAGLLVTTAGCGYAIYRRFNMERAGRT